MIDVVFLGGTCCGTTWRRERAIPFLQEHRIPYYDPVCLDSSLDARYLCIYLASNPTISLNIFHIVINTICDFLVYLSLTINYKLHAQ